MVGKQHPTTPHALAPRALGSHTPRCRCPDPGTKLAFAPCPPPPAGGRARLAPGPQADGQCSSHLARVELRRIGAALVAQSQVRAQGVVGGGTHHVCAHAKLGSVRARVLNAEVHVFTENQLSLLGDMLQGSLMLRYNKREM